MLVQIHKNIFLSSSFYRDFDNLFKHFRTGKHTLILDDIEVIEELKKSEWWEHHPKDQKIINKFIKGSNWKSSNRLSITISENDNSVNFLPKEADKYLDQALVILVENSDYDPPFVNAILRNFDTEAILINAKKEQWLRYGMGGGSSIGSVIKGDLENAFNHDCFTKHKSAYLRYFVLIDSDKKYPDMVVSDNKVRVFRENNVPYHVLHKREKENYVPLNVIRNLKDSYLDLYSRFPQDAQKDYFDIEKGFDNIARNKASKELQLLYPENDVSHKNWEVLKKGMKMAKYAGGKFKSDFSALFNGNDVTKTSMLDIIKHQPMKNNLNEYELIIEGIKRLL